jgi:putative membrane-bound dehydrogenase-like protein
LALLGGCALGLACVFTLPGQQPAIGPATEKRFPALKLPKGFRATLFACDPLIEYPSVIAVGPRPGSLFVGVDYLTGLGTQTTRRDEIRLIEDTDGDGYADRSTVFASGFNSVQGLAYHDGTVYVMHAPLLTALRDTKGTGKADERRDLLSGLGLPPEKNATRLHCANGVVVGHDGWLYLALGDHGCDVRRPEGDRLILEGGGILRCRPDGRDLHVFASGLRNIYDVALDEELNVFVRDNENDGGDYKVRVCHSFFGADHGYPYLYYEHPGEAVPPLADLGLGSSAGGVCYLERQFPPEFQGNLFFCEWGRAVVRYRPERAGSGFAPLKEIEFASGDPKDRYPFKPTDLVVDRDGSLLVADWADDQRPKRGRGRIYRITHSGALPDPTPAGNDLQAWIALLDSDSYHIRVEAQGNIERRSRKPVEAILEALAKSRLGVLGRLHAVWILARQGGARAPKSLFEVAGKDPVARVQAQAVRALADLIDPVLAQHSLDAGPGDAAVAARLAKLAQGKDPRVVREIVMALGRLRWKGAPDWLAKNLTRPDPFLDHAAMQTLRRCGNWGAVLRLIDMPKGEPIRAIALRAVAGQAIAEVVDGLIERLGKERDSGRRRAYADALTRVHKKRGPQPYWGYRPGPRPANTIEWDRTKAISQALDSALTDSDLPVRLAVLRAMQREKVPAGRDALGRWLRQESDPERLGVVLDALREQSPAVIRPLLERVITDRKGPQVGRQAALALFAAGLDKQTSRRLLVVAGSLENGPILAESLRHLAKWPELQSAGLVLSGLKSASSAVRAAALDASATLRLAGAEEAVVRLMDDGEVSVRRAAAGAAGKLRVRVATDALLGFAKADDLALRRASLESLRLLKESRAVPLAVSALAHPETQAAALDCIADLGGPEQAKAVVELARRDLSADVLTRVLHLLTTWSEQPGVSRADLEQAAADLQGSRGILACWHVTGPVPAADAAGLVERFGSAPKAPERPTKDGAPWQVMFATGPDSRVRLSPARGTDAVWLAYADVRLREAANVQLLAGSNAGLRVWLNGRQVYHRDKAGLFQPDADRFEAALAKGWNRLLVQLTSPAREAEFHLRFRRKSTRAEHEQLTQTALTRPGNAERGRKLFFDVQKAQCVKCHRLGDQGERIGPELTGVGSRFSRIHLIESILEPSRAIAPGYQTLVVVLKDGRVLTGVKVAETATTFTLGNIRGEKLLVAKADVDEQQPHAVSTMPEGLDRLLTTEEFVDLIAFLVSQKERRGQ